MQTVYIKTNYMKHISPKLFYSHELQQHGEISILQIKYYDNRTNLFTKLLSLAIFDKCVKCIGIKILKDFQCLWGRIPINNPNKIYHIVLFFFMSFTRISR
jgi:hypothetical protein